MELIKENIIKTYDIEFTKNELLDLGIIFVHTDIDKLTSWQRQTLDKMRQVIDLTNISRRVEE